MIGKQYDGTLYEIMSEITNDTITSLTGLVLAVYHPATTEETEDAVILLLQMMQDAVRVCGLPDVETYTVKTPIDDKNN